MLIGQRVILWFLALIMVPVLAVGSLFYFGFRGYVYDQTQENIEYTASVQQRRVQKVVNGYQRLLSAYTTRLLLPEAVDHYNRTHDIDDIRALNNSLGSSVKFNDQFINISILNLDGEVISSSDPNLIGRDYPDKASFDSYLHENTSINSLSLGKNGKLEIQLAGPILLGDKPVGVVSIVNSADELQKIASDYSRLGDTGETMIVRLRKNGDAEFITSLRFDKDASLKRTVSASNTNDPVIRALNENSYTDLDSTGYLGNHVMVATRSVEGTKWAVVVKIDLSEAFAALNTFNIIAATIIFIILAAGVFVAQYASRILTDPLIILTIAVREMSDGNLSSRVDLEANRISEGSEYGILAKAFNNMAANLENMDKMKTEFVMLTSHQLRTPASSVKGFLSMLIDGYVKKGSAEAEDILKSAYAENDQQLHLINQILAVSQAENHQMVLDKQNVNLVQLIKRIVRQLRPILIEHGQHIKLDIPAKAPLVEGDSEKLYMIIENIMVNAIKYSPEGAVLTVSAKYDRKGATLTFIDQGIGIETKDIDNLFKKFLRLSNTSDSGTQGSGLGLYLVKRLVDLHGGKIQVSSEGLNQGSTFTVWLPLKQD